MPMQASEGRNCMGPTWGHVALARYVGTTGAKESLRPRNISPDYERVVHEACKALEPKRLVTTTVSIQSAVKHVNYHYVAYN